MPDDLAPYAEEAHRLFTELKQLKAEAQERVFAMGERLYRIKEKQLWKALGLESMEEMLADPELAMKRSTAYRLVGLYRTYVRQLGLTEQMAMLARIDMAKLETIRPLLTVNNWREWVAKAQALSRSDLALVVREARGARQLPPSGEQTQLPQSERSYAQENQRLAVLHGEIIEAISMSGDGVVIKTDGGVVLRVWVEGGEVRCQVSQWAPQPVSRDEVAEV